MPPPPTAAVAPLLRLRLDDSGHVLTSDANARCRELLYEIEERLADRDIPPAEAAELLDRTLVRNPGWLQGLVLRAMVAEMLHDADKAADYCSTVYEAGFRVFDDSRIPVRLDPDSAENRSFLQAANRIIEHLRNRNRYEDAADAMLRMMRIPGAAHPGLSHDLGPTLLRADRTEDAVLALKEHARRDSDPACLYELALAAFEAEDFRAAATHLRRGAARNPEIAERLMGLRCPGPTALRVDSNLHGAEGADHYLHHWGRRWTDNPEARDFLRWLYTHPATCRERADAQEPREALYWEPDPGKRRELIENERRAFERIDDPLSEEIVVTRYNGQESPDYPWRVIRAARDRRRREQNTC